MHDMHLELATREDAVELLDLLAMNGLIDAPAETTQAAAQARWDNLQQTLPGVHVIVGRRCDGTVMGALTLVANANAPSAVLESLAVHRVMHREGLGRQLVQSAMAMAHEAGCSQLVVSPNPQHASALAFYERLGFERDGAGFGVSLPEARGLV